MQEEEEAAARDAEADRFFAELDTDSDGTVSIIELQARPRLDTNKDGTVSEEEVRFFLSGAESFDRETFRLSGFLLLKPYLVEEQEGSEEATGSEEGADTTADAASEAADHTAGDEETEAPATSTTPEVYDPWRANQGKDVEVWGAGIPSSLIYIFICCSDLLITCLSLLFAQAAEPEDYDDEADKEKDEEDYDVADQAPPPPSLYRSRDKEAVAEVAPPVSSYYAPR